LTVADVAFHQHAKKPSAVDAFGLRRSRPLYGDGGGFAAADESFESDESDDEALGAAGAGGRARRPTEAASSATGTVHATSSVERRSGAPQQRRRSSGGQYLREAPSSVRCSPAGERFTSSSATSHDVVAPGSPAVAGESGESEAATRARDAEDCMLGYIQELGRHGGKEFLLHRPARPQTCGSRRCSGQPAVRHRAMPRHAFNVAFST